MSIFYKMILNSLIDLPVVNCVGMLLHLQFFRETTQYLSKAKPPRKEDLIPVFLPLQYFLYCFPQDKIKHFF